MDLINQQPHCQKQCRCQARVRNTESTAVAVHTFEVLNSALYAALQSSQSSSLGKYCDSISQVKRMKQRSELFTVAQLREC
jgi:hypothetical protein